MIDFLDKIGNALGILFIIGIIAVANIALRNEAYISDAIAVKRSVEMIEPAWGRQ